MFSSFLNTMKPNFRFRFSLVLALYAVLFPSFAPRTTHHAPRAAAQEFQPIARRPETTMEFWGAMKFEIEVGRYELATIYLKGFIEKKPTDEELIKIEEREGMSAFLRLLNIPDSVKLPERSFKVLKEEAVPEDVLNKLKKIADKSYSSEKELLSELGRTLSAEEMERHNKQIVKRIEILSMRKEAGPLIERVSEVVRKHLSDPERITKFVKNLSATPEERAYAIHELRRSGAIAGPYLVETLRETADVEVRAMILSAMTRLNREIVPPLLAALDINDDVLRAELIDLLKTRGDVEAAPALWYFSASPKQPDFVRRKASAALAELLRTPKDRLPSAKVKLTQEAERYYLHQVKFPESVTIWQWDGEKFVLPPPNYTPSQAEEYFGLRFARQALDLDSTYQPAQIIFLSLALDKAYERAGLDQPVEKGSPTIKNLLRTVNPDLLSAVLDRALSEQRLPVILGAIQTLGDLTETRAARSSPDQSPPLVKALSFPDRRVQLAAADALLRFPGQPIPMANPRVIEVLRRNLAADATPKALVADAVKDRADAVAKAVKEAGFEPVVVHNGRDLMRRLAEAADIDVLLIDHALPDPGLPNLLAQLRADIDSGLLPVLITVIPEGDGKISVIRENSLRRAIGSYRNIWIEPATVDVETLKRALLEKITAATGRPLSEEEKKGNRALAMIWLKRLAIGEVPGYDVKLAEKAILQALRSEDLRGLAIEATGALPGRLPQRELANVMLDKGVRPELRSSAAIELSRHIQRHGLVLTKEQIQGAEELFQTTDDPKLKGNVALVFGTMRPDAGRTGKRLQGYVPPPPPPPPAPPAPPEKEPAPEKEDK